jgi:nucleoside 2-deoxyribosyltransferase
MDRTLPKMYLAGPIAGLSYDGCTEWREYVTRELDGLVECLNPMRAKAYLEGHTEIDKEYKGDHWFKSVMSSSRGIMKRDHWDCMRCDIILVNFNSDRVSLGTCMEIAWGYTRMIPVIAVMDHLHDHPMINEAITHLAPGLDEAIEVVRALV